MKTPSQHAHKLCEFCEGAAARDIMRLEDTNLARTQPGLQAILAAIAMAMIFTKESDVKAWRAYWLRRKGIAQ
ncbi:MAG: hypothetical protein AAFR17_08630 [Pseudomonadota bacterium]